MDDLRIPPGPGCPRGLRVPAVELIERFSHASGPGGQGVNTSDSRVQLGLDLATTTALDEQQRERALAHLRVLIDMIQRAPVDRPHLDGQQIERRSLADPPDAGKQQAAERSHYHNVGNGVQRARIMPQIHAIASDATRRCIFSDA